MRKTVNVQEMNLNAAVNTQNVSLMTGSGELRNLILLINN